MTSKTYDPQEEARLIALADSKESQRQDIAKRMRDMTGYDEDAPGVIPEGKGWDADQLMQFKQLEAQESIASREVKAIKDAIAAIQKAKPADTKSVDVEEAKSALNRWLDGGNDALSDDEVRDQADRRKPYGKTAHGSRAFVDDTFRAILIPNNATQGSDKVIDEEVVQSVIQGLGAYGGAVDCCTLAFTRNGNKISYPTYWDGATTGLTPKQATKIDLDATSPDGSLAAFQEREIDAYALDTGFIQVSRFFEEDVDWDVGAFVQNTLMRRAGRKIEDFVTNGSGTNEPNGLITAATPITSATNAANFDAGNWTNLVDFMHKMDPAYLKGEMGLFGYPTRMGKIGWMMNWKFLGLLKQAKDGDNRPLVLPSVIMNDVSTLFGYPVFINQEIADSDLSAAAKKPILFGNFSTHVIRFAGQGLMIEEHYDSSTAKTNHNLYLGKMRMDSESIVYCPTTGTNAGKNPAIMVYSRKT